MKKIMSVIIVGLVLTLSTLAQAQTRTMEFTEQPTCEFVRGFLVIKVSTNTMWVTNSGQPWPANTRYNIHQHIVRENNQNRTNYWVGVQPPGASEIPVTMSMVAGAAPVNVPETNVPGGTQIRATNGYVETRTPGNAWTPAMGEDTVIVEQIPHLNPRRPFKHNGEPNIVAYSYYIYNTVTGETTVINPDLSRRWTDVFDTGAKLGATVGIVWILFLVFFCLI